MCGIAGYAGPRELEPSRLERCLELMRHRGPDAAAWEHWRTREGRHVYLLSTRLAIIDLEPRSNMPFGRDEGHIVTNGELYNYVELRRELESEGQTFRTRSDTEVLAAVLRERGAAGLDDCEGMWAFAWYDERDGSLLLARDRFGEKPLYVRREADGGLAFGSEAKLVAELLGRRPAPNHDQLARYLVNGYKALYKERSTFFEDLEELPAATFLRVDADGREHAERYWKPDLERRAELSYDEAVTGTRERLIEAMRLRLRADVPLAFCMSGGVDSVSLISVARRVLDYDVHAFTIVNTDERYEEQELVARTVGELGVDHTAIPLSTEDFLPRLRRLVRHHDAPVYTITYFVHWLLMEAIHEHGYKISTSGTAADELFSGYYDHHLAYLHAVRGDAERYGGARAAWEAHVRPVVRNPFLADAELFDRDPGFRDHIYLAADEFAASLIRPWAEPFVERKYASELLRNRMLNELFHESVPVILHEDDLNAMSFSIENRSPYLDRALFEFASTIPTRHLVRDGRAKAVLRDAMRGIAPAPVLNSRRKVGFNAPVHALLDTSDPAVRGTLLEDSPIFDHVRRDRIEALLDRQNLRNSESKFLFNFLNSKLFLEEYAA